MIRYKDLLVFMKLLSKFHSPIPPGSPGTTVTGEGSPGVVECLDDPEHTVSYV